MTTGHFVAYVPKNFRQESLDRLADINAIIEEYESKGYPMSVRQLYYQLVARGKIENNDKEYSKLQGLISDGRLAGLVSWTAIEDRGRNLMGLATHTSPQAAVRDLLQSYKNDLWIDQRFRPEVWVEKAALEGVIGEICNKLRVNFFSCRGYNSQSEQWRAGRRFARYISKGQTPIVFHLGDHDPSGIDMTRDNRERLSLFAGVMINVQRLALSRPQIDRYRPPPNSAKITDSRYDDYRREHGEQSWELDALDPSVIHSLIEEAVGAIRESDKWDAALKQEADDKLVLESFADEAGEDE